MLEREKDSIMERFWLDPRKYSSFSIPWDKFEEIEIQAIIKLMYESKGYEVHWVHVDDRAHEVGADLVCHKRGKRKSIAVAVKKKPLKKDLYQLLELSNSSSDEKIYVYSGKATVRFQKEKRKYQNIVFWTFADLQEKLFSETFEIGFDLVADNSPFTTMSLDLFHKICNFVISEESQREAKHYTISSSPKLLSLLWDVKDRISVLHKGTKVLQAILEVRELLQELSYDKLLLLFSTGLNFLLLDSLQQLRKGIEYILTDYRTLLSKSYSNTRIRSNWRIFQDLLPYDFKHVFQPSKVVEKCISIQKQSKLFPENLEDQNKLEELMNLEIVRDKVRIFSNFFQDMESIIDDLFELVNR